MSDRVMVDRAERLEAFLGKYAEVSQAEIEYLIRGGLAERPDPTTDPGERFLVAAAAAAEITRLNIHMKRCFQLLTGKKLISQKASTCHEGIRAFVRQYEDASMFWLYLIHLKNRSLYRLSQFVHMFGGPSGWDDSAPDLTGTRRN